MAVGFPRGCIVGVAELAFCGLHQAGDIAIWGLSGLRVGSACCVAGRCRISDLFGRAFWRWGICFCLYLRDLRAVLITGKKLSFNLCQFAHQIRLFIGVQ